MPRRSPPKNIEDSIVGRLGVGSLGAGSVGVTLDLPGRLGIETRLGRLRREAEVTRQRDLAEEREACEGSLVMFMARAWEEIEPGELDINWHHQEIAGALEAITAGEMRALIINQPPRTTKTLMCNVFWPAWIWAQPEDRWGPLAGPHVRFLCVSYGATLSEEIAVKMRRLVTGEWYQSLWGDRVKIREDQQNRANFANTAGGERMSNSIEGGLLGRGGDIQICFPYSEIIHTECGGLPIGEIVEKKLSLKVWSLNHSTEQFELRSIIGWHLNPGRRLVRIVTDRGDLRCTEDHRILTVRGYVRACDLLASDFVYSALSATDLADGCSTDSMMGRDFSDRAGVVRHGANCLGWDYGGSGTAVWVDRQVEVSPGSPGTNGRDDRWAHPITLSQHLAALSAGGNFADVVFGEVCGTVPEAAMFFAVSDVLGASAVFEATQCRLSAVAVDVSDLLTFGAGAEECQRNEAMDLSIEMFTVQSQSDAWISVGKCAGHDFPGHMDIPGPAADSRQTLYPDEVGDFVSREPLNRHPTFLRVERIEFIHEIPPSTYCLTVEHNHNMIMGQARICVSNCDDPHHLVGAESTLQRKATLEGMRSLVTRVTDPRISARVLVMQRLHTDDATNYALENWPGVRHLCYPMRFNADIASMQPTDPREYDGELLWPTVWTEQAVAAEERELTPYGVAGQLQQSPVPRGGGIILRNWWRLWPDDAPEAAGMDAGYRCPVCKWVGYVRAADADGIACPSCGSLATREVPFPPFSFRLLSVDTNFGEKEENSWSAATCWEVWHGKDDAPRVMLTYAWRGRPHLHATKEAAAKGDLGLVERIHEIANRRQIDVVLIEHKTRGEDLYHELARQSVEWPYRLEWFEPTGRGDKIARLNAVSGLFTADLVWAPNKAWAETVITEVCEARPGTVGDLTDTASQALIYLRQSHLLPTTEEYTREARRSLVFRGNRPGVAAEIEGL